MANDNVKIVEVGPRDGLQNEKQIISSEIKIELIERLADAGMKSIESASFVSPKWVPQMGDASAVMQGITRQQDISYSALVPNLKGMQGAIDAGVKEVAIFTAASEAFCQKNINCSIQESLARFDSIVQLAQKHDIAVRGYVSTVLGCPYQGQVDFQQVATVSNHLFEMGCYEVSLGDTIGVGTARDVKTMLEIVAEGIPMDKLAVHFHDSYGQAVANIYAAIEMGVRTIDSSVAGLGGCPYAKGASGNVASEDVVYLLNGLGLNCGIDLDKLASIGHWISAHIDKPNNSKVGLAMLAHA
jgi:hydroxymethylglutaryl-CoA lyase